MSTSSWQAVERDADPQAADLTEAAFKARSVIRANQAAATQAQRTPGWSTVVSKGGRRNAKGNLSIAPKAPAPQQGGTSTTPTTCYPALPKAQNQPMGVDDSHSWIIRFHGYAPPYADCVTDREMFCRVNSIRKDKWRFDVLTAKWTHNGEGHAINLRFSSDSTDAAIQAHQIAILE